MPENGIANDLVHQVEKLQLPRKPEGETSYDWILPVIESNGLSEGDAALKLAEDVASWRGEGTPSKFLKQVVGAYLEFYREDEYSISEDQYFALFAQVRRGSTKWRGCDWWTTRSLLSKARVIGYLQCEERYSASKVVQLLSATDASLYVPFQAVQCIGNAFQALIVAPDPEVIDREWQADAELGDELFADANLKDSLAIASGLINEFRPHSDVASLMRDLVSRDLRGDKENLNWPYLQMLYWQSLIVSLYDHPAGSLYEFNPRGKSANHVFAKFGLSTNNPFLNNAKATASLDKAWALNRGGQDAHALVSLLSLMEELPYFSRSEVAKAIRAWCVRTLSIAKEKKRQIRSLNSGMGFEHLSTAVCGGETYTHGVIEQRVVDALGLLAFAMEDAWRPSGLGDHVNATNTSRRKLGDIEFANVGKLHAIAVEAHGGKLTSTYVRSHLMSLEKSLVSRLENSWVSLAPAEEWAVDVYFVAHGFSLDEVQPQLVLAGVPVNLHFMTYQELKDMAWSRTTSGQRAEVFETWVIDVLNSDNVRQSVRDRALRLLRDEAEMRPFDS